MSSTGIEQKEAEATRMRVLEGNCAVMPSELSRSQVAQELGITVRQLQKYLNIARLFLCQFEDFTHPGTGELNQFQKLNEWHVEPLKKMRDRVRAVGMTQVKIELSEGRL